jgi:predicted small secreted protein
MMKLSRTFSASLLILAALALTACQKQEGPAEHAGKEIDKTVEKVGRQIEKTGDSIEDATKRDKK